MTMFCCLAGITARAQFPVSGMLQRYQSDAGLMALSADLFAAVQHPAGPALVSRYMAGMQSERFTWPGAPAHTSLAVLAPTASGHFSLFLGHAGMDGYAALQGSLGYARYLGNWLQGGVRMNYYRISAKGYSPRTAWPVDLGLVIRLSDKLVSDMAAWNILGARLNRRPETRLPRAFRSGIAYHLSELAGISVSLLAEEGSKVSCQASVFYRFHPKLACRLAYATTQQGISLFGFYDISGLRVSVGFGYSFMLGSQGLAGVQYAWPQKTMP
jgi:hypothetical protein